MIPAALATIRAAVEVAHGNGLEDAEDVAQLVADELEAQGWTLATLEDELAPQQAA
ncbi:hypothetical protein ACNYS0_20095 [Streptomyces sp. BH034]|uniref:hypothetical protein n=1 Tax=Streptomyces sp. BH034 TaxID=3402626 RepID=UPI003BB810C6